MTNASPPADPAAGRPLPELGPPGAHPFLVEVTRGSLVESRHAVDAAVVDIDGRMVAAWGAVGRPVYARSAIKPIQALPLLESGAADAFRLTDREIALACASHAGEPVHVEAVTAWLQRIGLSDDDLECGAHPPRNETVLAAFARSGAPLLQAHNNCSGKHAGMLSHAVHLGEPTSGYVRPEHPAQRRVSAAIAEMCGVDPAAAPMAVDGCSIPTFGVPLDRLAHGMARLANPDRLAARRAAACRRIAAAMIAESYMVAGLNRCCTALLRAGRGSVIAKTGAEGVYMAGLPGRGLGLALKVRDGAGRAAELACVALLARFGGLDERALSELSDYLVRPVTNVRGVQVGMLRAAPWETSGLTHGRDKPRRVMLKRRREELANQSGRARGSRS